MSYIPSFSHIEPKITDALNYGDNTSDFKFSQLYVNDSMHDITIILRNNLPITSIRSTGTYKDNRKFTIRNIYNFRSNERIIMTIQNLTEFQKTYGSKQLDIEIIRKLLLLNYNNDRFCSNVTISIDYVLDIQTIRDQEAIYIPETDALVLFGGYDTGFTHPFSIEGHAMNEYRELIKEKKVSGIFLELIDNENNIKSRYIYVAKQLLEIPVRKDPNRPSGVYFTKAAYDRVNDVHINPEFYSYEDSEKELGLYKTKEEANTGGNPELINKNLLAEKEKELVDAKHRLESIVSNNKERINQLETELELKKKETAAIKEEYEEKKIKRTDYYEERSSVRKDSNEIVKFIPAVIAGAVAAFAIISSRKKG